jgi:hypothetical protein
VRTLERAELDERRGARVDDQSLAARVGSAEAIDPFLISVDCLLVVAFAKSNSKNYPLALALAQGAARYAIMDLIGTPMNVAAFGKTQADAGRAVALLKYVQSWKGTLIFSRGRLVENSFQVSQVIRCYLDACACRDPHAYCHVVIDDPRLGRPERLVATMTIQLAETAPELRELQVPRYVFPCKFLHQRFRFEEGHPSSPQDQIQAAGVRFGLTSCPNFVPDDFTHVGFRTVLVEVPRATSTNGRQGSIDGGMRDGG